MTVPRTIRPRKCAAVHPNGMRCRNKFIPRNSGHVVCSPECAVIKGQADKAKKARKEHRESKIKAKTRADWMGEAQAAFNAYIRARDEMAGYPCISCAQHNRSAWDAGHYRATSTAPALRFHEDNVHRQCIPCNRHKHGNLLDYRAGLIARIGLERVEWLEGQHEPAKYTIPELQEIKLKYSTMARALICQKH